MKVIGLLRPELAEWFYDDRYPKRVLGACCYSAAWECARRAVDDPRRLGMGESFYDVYAAGEYARLFVRLSMERAA